VSEKKKKNLPLIAAIALVSLLVIAGAGYVWYTHTPYYAVQQVGVSIAKHDSRTFYEYFDSRGVVGSLTDELFFQPAMRTRGMSEFQNFIAAGAIVMTKNRIDTALLTSIDRIVSPPVHTSFYHVFPQSLGENVYQDQFMPQGKIRLVANRKNATPAQEEKLDLGDLAKSVGQELKTEQQDLKRLAAQRMQEYATIHQDQLIGRLLAGPSNGQSMKTMFAEYGFSKENFRTMYFQKVDDRDLLTAEFFAPKINANIPVSLELIPTNPGDLLPNYRVARAWHMKDTMKKLGEDTDTQVQELIRYGLQDVAPQQAADRTRDLLKRITRHEGAQKLLDKLKGRF